MLQNLSDNRQTEDDATTSGDIIETIFRMQPVAISFAKVNILQWIEAAQNLTDTSHTAQCVSWRVGGMNKNLI